jgi:molybdopterin-containing oxidoreductase family iron-sulfur binding subunit
MADKLYWKGLEEKHQHPAFTAHEEREFAENIPFLSEAAEVLATKGNTSRRDFLKMLGFSVTAATVAASCEMPVRKSIPYAWKPEEIVPGVASYYASVYFSAGEYNAILVKTREGRPIKIEGNKLSSITKGGTSARAQASVLSLYDGGRYKNPRRGKENINWEVADKEVKAKLDTLKASGSKVALFTSTIASPSTKAAIKEFLATYPNIEHLVYDAVSYSALLDANQQCFGVRAIPNYQFAKAKVIVGVGADYLGTWLNHTEYETDWATNRRISKEKPEMSKTFQIESLPTITGFKADLRVPVKPADELAALITIHNIVTGSNFAGGVNHPKVEAAAKALLSAKGESLLVCGINSISAQLLTNAINLALNNYGKTLSFDRPVYLKQGSDTAATALYEGLKNGTYKGVLFYESNPVYYHPKGKELAELISKTELSVSFANRIDETSSVVGYVLPDNHYLESWNDIEVKAGVFNTVQPAISKLFDTRQFQETLLAYCGKPTNYYEYIQKYWEANIYPKQNKYNGFWAFWDTTLHDGEVVLSLPPATLAAPKVDAVAAADALAKEMASYGEAQIKLYESLTVGDGTHADNPWLLEIPDPVSKVTWDNFVMVSPKFAEKNGLLPDLNMKDYHVIKLKAGETEIELPVVAVPGTPEGTFGIALGFGRTAVHHPLLKNGRNAYPLLTESGIVGNVSWSNTNKTEKLAITQTHHNLTLKGLGGVRTRKIVKEATLSEYKNNPYAGNEDREEILHELVTLYPTHERPGHHWTMVVDLNTCTGCSACVVACNAENNIPVVGKDQVIRAREMHWLRIDRYFAGSEDDPTVVFQPMLCQHCDNAPCENVCPVAATNHSSEGLNQMTYNRCIGTRYCANNCPYKVRRFNWYDYAGNDSFDKKWGTGNDEGLASYQLGLREPVSRMVLNPDVTVRSRGVIEKCSFCVQRLQEAKLTAKKENRILKDGEAQTACQTACPTGAISFGDRNMKDAAVAKLFHDERAFGVIEEIHTLPNVVYLTKIRNTEEEKQA